MAIDIYYSSFLCVLHFIVVFLLCHISHLKFDMMPPVSVCNPDLLFSQWIYEFRIAVYYCCLYLMYHHVLSYRPSLSVVHSLSMHIGRHTTLLFITFYYTYTISIFQLNYYVTHCIAFVTINSIDDLN